MLTRGEAVGHAGDVVGDGPGGVGARGVGGGQLLGVGGISLEQFAHDGAGLAGHVHHHATLWHGREAGIPEGGSGFWEITTSSLIDWPQQGRILEFIREQDSLAIVSTVVDHRAPASRATNDLGSVTNLASISRALAANDYRLRGEALRGLTLESSPAVRNTVWRVTDPHFALDMP